MTCPLIFTAEPFALEELFMRSSNYDIVLFLSCPIFSDNLFLATLTVLTVLRSAPRIPPPISSSQPP